MDDGGRLFKGSDVRSRCDWDRDRLDVVLHAHHVTHLTPDLPCPEFPRLHPGCKRRRLVSVSLSLLSFVQGGCSANSPPPTAAAALPAATKETAGRRGASARSAADRYEVTENKELQEHLQNYFKKWVPGVSIPGPPPETFFHSVLNRRVIEDRGEPRLQAGR